MNVFYTVNDAFVPQLGAALCSVCENNRDMDSIVFHVGELGVTEEHREQLRTLAAGYGREISFISVEGLRERLGFEFDTLGWSEIVVARLLLDTLLPEDVDRVLYLDGDTIVTGSLRELWETDMEGKAIAASAEPTVNRKRRAALGLENLLYYNSGVLLIDLKRWREERTGRRILDFYREKGGKLFAPDQDAINGALPGKILTLPPKYNFYNIFWYYPYRTLAKIQRPAEYIPEDVFRDSLEDVRIIHYLGEDRPWRKGNTHRYAGEYEKYLAMTPWKDTPKEEGWETYFKLYGAFWKVLKPFPMLQYRIIDALIPAMMRMRKAGRKKKEAAAGEGTPA